MNDKEFKRELIFRISKYAGYVFFIVFEVGVRLFVWWFAVLSVYSLLHQGSTLVKIGTVITVTALLILAVIHRKGLFSKLSDTYYRTRYPERW